jgi:lipopolysaccharide assembly protein A
VTARKIVYWLVTALVGLVLVVFAANNRDYVRVEFWPFLVLQARLYLVVLLALLIGFFVGELVAWINGGRWRRAARRHARRVEELERTLATAQDKQRAAQAAPLAAPAPND